MRAFVSVFLLLFAVAARGGTIDQADVAGGQLFVHGSGFGVFKTPLVTLGGIQLAVVSYSPTDVVATVPGADPGTYSLHVKSFTTANKGSDDTLAVTVGAVGPQGPPGPATPDARFGANTSLAAGGATGRTCTLGEIPTTRAFFSACRTCARPRRTA